MEMQKHNFTIEDDVLEKLSLLKGFNDEVRAVSDGAQHQCKVLRQTINQNLAEHRHAVQDQEDTAALQKQLAQLE